MSEQLELIGKLMNAIDEYRADIKQYQETVEKYKQLVNALEEKIKIMEQEKISLPSWALSGPP